jgi:hypothetical protein
MWAAILIPLQRHNSWPFKVEIASQWRRESMLAAALVMSSADNITTFKSIHCRSILTPWTLYSINKHSACTWERLGTSTWKKLTLFLTEKINSTCEYSAYKHIYRYALRPKLGSTYILQLSKCELKQHESNIITFYVYKVSRGYTLMQVYVYLNRTTSKPSWSPWRKR